MNEITELAKIIDNKLTTLKSDDILVVVCLPSENIYILKTLKESIYKPNKDIFEITFSRKQSYTDILRKLDNAFEWFKFH